MFNQKGKILFIVFLILSLKLQAQKWEKILDLSGNWNFSIGDEKEWANQNYDDFDWEQIYVPSFWEDEGFYGYNGYAWYRISFEMPQLNSDETIYLHLGYIDDVDQVFLNGELIGFSGSFPPDYKTAYNAERKYAIPKKFFKKGKNTIAVRVFDSTLGGGITSGNIGLYKKNYPFIVEKNLEGYWKFNVHDSQNYNKKDFDDSSWDSIYVPAYWETQGYPDYNGIAWYRKTFPLYKLINDDKLVLILGKIDDIDQTYLNGKFIGQTGEFSDDIDEISFYHEWQEFRAYLVDRSLLNINGNNTIAVKVYDGYINGGIYEGPIGIMTQKEYLKTLKKINRKKSFWDYFFD